MKKMRILMTLLCVPFVLFSVIVMLGEPTADSFIASDRNLAAAVGFTKSGNDLLKVTLADTSSSDVLIPSHVLTTIRTKKEFIEFIHDFFTPPDIKLTPISASLNGSTGISSSGLGFFGSANFNGSNLQGPVNVAGSHHGMASAGDIPGTGNAGAPGNVSLGEKPSILPISGPTERYGTAPTESNMPVPEPITLLLLGLGLVGLAGFRRKFKK